MTNSTPELPASALHATHRRYLIVDQCVGAMIVNVLLNAGIAWLLFRSLDVVPLWGERSIAGDLIGTTFFLPFFTCLIVTPLTHSAVKKGRLAQPGFRRASHAWLRRLPARTLVRSLVLGLTTMVLAAPLSLLALHQLGAATLAFWPFVAFKGLYAGALAALVTPPIALAALGDVLDRSVEPMR